MKKSAVITGADSGLGREYTRLIVEESDVDEIWALAKTPARKLWKRRGSSISTAVRSWK